MAKKPKKYKQRSFVAEFMLNCGAFKNKVIPNKKKKKVRGQKHKNRTDD